MTTVSAPQRRYFWSLLFAGLLVLLAIHLAVPINLTVSDIGRHVKNGQLLLQGHHDLLFRNFYSYTQPDFPFINHHWFFGVLSYAVWLIGGFKLLSIAYILVLVAAAGLFIQAARARGHQPLVLFFTCLSLPLLIDRREIRPEGISMLLMGLYFSLLTASNMGRIQPRVLYAVILIGQVIWVNTHIFFFMGPMLIAVFLWEAQLRRCSVCVKTLRPLLFLALLVNLVNPSGLAGALTPLNSFGEFGYRLAENQNVFFMMGRFPQQRLYGYYLVMAALVVLGMSCAVRMRGWRSNAPWVCFTLFALAAGFKAVRLMAPFGFLLIVLGPFFYRQIEGAWSRLTREKMRQVILTASLLLMVLYAWNLTRQNVGAGLLPKVNGSAEFFKTQGVKGPVFSNYDIGGYLIYHLAPSEKVFVDNRQEAYSPGFFKELYVPVQESEGEWRRAETRFGFNTIYFYRHDLTPWGQEFLVRRIQDPDWAPVFVDDFTIVFVKRDARNSALIQKFELPRSMFAVKHR